MKNCHKKLKELIEEVVLADIEDSLDNIYEEIAKNKNANDSQNETLQELHEMREEFQGILQEIEDRELSKDECIELYEEITDMLSDEEDED
jgi:phosphoglycolate phosphatase-like HAD superfamily hydrolase